MPVKKHYDNVYELLRFIGFAPRDYVQFCWEIVEKDDQDSKQLNELFEKTVSQIKLDEVINSEEGIKYKADLVKFIREKSLSVPEHKSQLVKMTETFLQATFKKEIERKNPDDRIEFLKDKLKPEALKQLPVEQYGVLLLAVAEYVPDRLPILLEDLSKKKALVETLNQKHFDGDSIFKNLIRIQNEIAQPVIIQHCLSELSKNPDHRNLVLEQFYEEGDRFSQYQWLNALIKSLLSDKKQNQGSNVLNTVLEWHDKAGNNSFKYIAEVYPELLVDIEKQDPELFINLLKEKNKIGQSAMSRIGTSEYYHDFDGKIMRLLLTHQKRLPLKEMSKEYREHVFNRVIQSTELNDSTQDAMRFLILLFNNEVSSSADIEKQYSKQLSDIAKTIERYNNPRSLYDWPDQRPSPELMDRLKLLQALMTLQLSIGKLGNISENRHAERAYEAIRTAFVDDGDKDDLYTRVFKITNEQILTILHFSEPDRMGKSDLYKHLDSIREVCFDRFVDKRKSLRDVSPSAKETKESEDLYHKILGAMNKSIDSCSSWGSFSGEGGERKKDHLMKLRKLYENEINHEPPDIEKVNGYIKSFILQVSQQRENKWTFFGDQTAAFGQTRSAKVFYEALTDPGARKRVAEVVAGPNAQLEPPNHKNQDKFVSLLKSSHPYVEKKYVAIMNIFEQLKEVDDRHYRNNKSNLISLINLYKSELEKTPTNNKMLDKYLKSFVLLVFQETRHVNFLLEDNMVTMPSLGKDSLPNRLVDELVSYKDSTLLYQVLEQQNQNGDNVLGLIAEYYPPLLDKIINSIETDKLQCLLMHANTSGHSAVEVIAQNYPKVFAIISKKIDPALIERYSQANRNLPL